MSKKGRHNHNDFSKAYKVNIITDLKKSIATLFTADLPHRIIVLYRQTSTCISGPLRVKGCHPQLNKLFLGAISGYKS